MVPNAKSILAVECGSSNTTAALVEQTAAGYRLRATSQAPSTHTRPWQDITLGVQEAIRFIEAQVGRTLLTSGGWPITPHTRAGQGVDAFLIVTSAGPPLRLVLASLTQDISLVSARRAAASTYTHVGGVLLLEAEDGSHQRLPDQQLQILRETQPDVILLTGGTDGGAVQPVIDMAEVIALALQTTGIKPPTVIFAGNNALRPRMADILGTVSALTSVDNVRPLLDFENSAAVRAELERLYIDQKMGQLPGFDKLKNWSKYEVVPAGKSFERLIAFVGQQHGLNVLGANIGSQSTVIATQNQEGFSATIRSDAGLGRGLALLLEQVPVANIRRWLPFELTETELRDQLLNKSLQPATLPTSPEDLMIEHAVAREALRLAARQARLSKPDCVWNLVIAAGRPLTGAPAAAHAAMVLLDGLEPWGVTSLALDRSSIVNLLGAIAAATPLAAVQLAQHDTFLNLGTVVAPAGHGLPGKPALKLKITFPDESVTEREILYGELVVIDLAGGQKARLEIRPTRQFDVGLGQFGRGAVAEVEGGLLGLIIDARGRPLRLPADEKTRLGKLQQWLKALKVSYAPPVD